MKREDVLSRRSSRRDAAANARLGKGMGTLTDAREAALQPEPTHGWTAAGRMALPRGTVVSPLAPSDYRLAISGLFLQGAASGASW